MTQEDKELLLKDLSARLPYHVRCKIWLKEGTTEEGPLDLQHNYGNVLLDAFYYNKIKDIKPYLRPISSMTKKEVDELFHILKINEENPKEWLKVNDIGIIRLFTEEGKDFYEIAEAIDYLNSIHIDYRGMIENDLAIEAPEEMYNIKEQ